MILRTLFLSQASAQDLDPQILFQIDSLRAKILKTDSLRKKVEIYAEIGYIYQRNEAYPETIKSYRNALQLIDSDKFPELYAKVNLELGSLFGGLAYQADSSFHYAEQAYSVFEKISPTLQVDCLSDLTHAAHQIDHFAEATQYCLDCIDLAKKIGYQRQLGECYGYMAHFSGIYLQDTEKVKLYSKLALDLSLKGRELSNIRRAWIYLGYVSNLLVAGENDTALVYLALCKKSADLSEDKEMLVEYFLYKGSALLGLERLEAAKESYIQGCEWADSLGYFLRQMHFRLRLGWIEFSEKQYKSAARYATEALLIAPDKLTLYELEGAHNMLRQAYEGLGNPKKELYHLKQWITYKDSLQKLNNLGVIASLEGEFKSKEQQQQIDFQQKKMQEQDEQRSLIIAAMLAFLALSAGLLFFFLKVKTSREMIREQHELISQQAAELQQLDKMKSRFFANVSHELRTPLTLMLGPISSVLKTEELSDRNISRLEKAKHSGKNLLKLIGSILDLSKMESGKMQLNEKPEILFRFVRRLASAFESHAEREGIQFVLDYQVEQGLQLNLDKEKLEIILNNLLSNALKFTAAGGRVSVKVEDKADLIQVSVTDTGRGIHPDDLPHVFDRFYQSNQPDAATEGGTGIGLALSQEFVKLMGGEIRVESVLGKGSTFVFSFARKDALHILREVAETEILTKNKKSNNLEKTVSLRKSNARKILLVEDNYALCEYLQSILEDHYKVIPAENGKVALERLAQNSDCQLILSDIMMPVMDGYQLLSQLKSDSRYRHLPVIMLTARADIQDKLKALRIGVDDYLLKPFEEEELLVRIENLLQNAQQRHDFVREEKPQGIVEQPSLSLKDQAWLEQLETVILENLSDTRFSIGFVGEKIGIGRRQLSRKIKKMLGLTGPEYINQIRLHQARQRLEADNSTQIKALALELGFSDVEYFSQQYKKRFGKLPSEY